MINEEAARERQERRRETSRRTREQWSPHALRRRQDNLLASRNVVSVNSHDTAVVFPMETDHEVEGQKETHFAPLLLVATESAKELGTNIAAALTIEHARREQYVNKAARFYQGSRLSPEAMFTIAGLSYCLIAFLARDLILGLVPALAVAVMLLIIRGTCSYQWHECQKVWQTPHWRDLAQFPKEKSSVLLHLSYPFGPQDLHQGSDPTSIKFLAECQEIITPEIQDGLRLLVNNGHTDQALSGLNSILSEEADARRSLIEEEREKAEALVKKQVFCTVIEPYRQHAANQQKEA